MISFFTEQYKNWIYIKIYSIGYWTKNDDLKESNLLLSNIIQHLLWNVISFLLFTAILAYYSH